MFSGTDLVVYTFFSPVKLYIFEYPDFENLCDSVDSFGIKFLNNLSEVFCP
jgi:hypothetical protein